MADEIADPRPLDLDDLRAHVGERAGCKRAGEHLFEGRDFYAVECAAGFSISCHSEFFLSLNLER